MKRKTIGLIICASGLLYAVVETHYFGSHFWPESPSEVIADGIATVIMAIGLTMMGGPHE